MRLGNFQLSNFLGHPNGRSSEICCHMSVNLNDGDDYD